MQFHRTFSLKIEVKIVISVILAAYLLCGCRRKEQTVFTETVYASDRGYSVKEDYEDSYSGTGAGTAQGQAASGKTEPAQDGTAGATAETGNTICVFVCGAVNCEGVYELPDRSRVIDAVEAAGGYSEDADRTYVNQAEYVYDTQRIEIPTEEEAQMLREYGASNGEDEDGGQEQDDGLIDLNTADKQELMTLPGIGESKAERIIEYRQIHGRFSSTEELMNVSGIGSGVYEKMKDYITVK